MIKKIESIKEYGIFRNFHWNATLPDFGKVNLFYGLNGSGKSTLGTIFDDIKNQEQKYYHGSFKLIDDEIGAIESKNLTNINYNLYIFNTHFIEDNIGEFEQLKGIIYLSEENKIAKATLDALQKEYITLSQKHNNAQSTYDTAQKTLDSTYTKAARAIKEEFHVIGGLGNKYSNYNKSSFERALSIHSTFLKDKHELKDILSQIDLLKTQLADSIKDIIPEDLPYWDYNKFVIETGNIMRLFNTTLKKCLKENIGDEIFTWLEEGYKLHKDTNQKCKYCGNLISKERQEELDALFNDELLHLKEDLNKAKLNLEKFRLPEINLSESDFYATQRKDVKILLQKYKELRVSFNCIIDDFLMKINEKLAAPFDVLLFDFDVKSIPNGQTIFSKFKDLITEANNTTTTFIKKQAEAIDAIEKLLVCYHFIQGNIVGVLSNLKKASKNLLDIQTELRVNGDNRAKCENELRDVIKASNEFNGLLAKFLGRKELELQYDEHTKGYQIIRKETGINARFLSEGEKTAIAFVYFLTKVHENGNDIKNSIIVFDDPISSFDSNHLYNAYSFITTYFSNCKQLFILTHNFNFFKLIRKKYCKQSQMYLIECRYTQTDDILRRCSNITILPKSIKQASSEYTYLFEKVYKFFINYTDSQVIEFDDYMQMSNTCRKIIESFSSFKIQNVNDLSQKIERLYKCNQSDDYNLSYEEKTECEQIYRFINAFSHESIFDENGETDIVFGELHIIIENILNLIKRADKDHFAAMVASIS